MEHEIVDQGVLKKSCKEDDKKEKDEIRADLHMKLEGQLLSLEKLISPDEIKDAENQICRK